MVQELNKVKDMDWLID